MSGTSTHTHRDSHGQVNNGRETAVNRSGPPADSAELMGRAMSHPPDQITLAAVEQFVARVLLGAHQAAETINEPDEARAVFHVAVTFAAELEAANPDFDRTSFIKAATGL